MCNETKPDKLADFADCTCRDKNGVLEIHATLPEIDINEAIRSAKQLSITNQESVRLILNNKDMLFNKNGNVVIESDM